MSSKIVEGVKLGGTECLCRLVWTSYRFELEGEQHAAIFSTTLSTTNMFNWHSFAAAVDDATAVLDSFSLENRRRAYLTAYARRSIREGREGEQNENT